MGPEGKLKSKTRDGSQPSTGKNSRNARFVSGVLFSILSGILLLLSFPPYGIWWFMWIGFVPMLLAQHRLLPIKWSSLAAGLALLFWLGPYLWRLFGDEVPFAFRPMGVYIAILNFFMARERKFHENTGYRWFILQGTIGWVGFEMIRTFIPMLATNAFTGYTQATQAWLIQPVSIFGIYGLDLVILFVNYAIAQLLFSFIDRKWNWPDVVQVDQRLTRNWGMAAGILLAAWAGLSLTIFNRAPAKAPTIRVAALQPNFPLPAFQDEVNTEAVRMESFFDQTREAVDQGAQVIFTPEMYFGFDPQVEHTQEFRALAEETGAYFFLSYIVTEDGWRNEAILLTPQGEFLQYYGKFHVFGEPPTSTAGPLPVYDTELGRLATVICHDANYTDITRKLSRSGAQLIAAPFREFGGFGEQLWTNVVFRAVENRTAMVVTGVATISGVVDPYGRLAALNSNIQGERLVTIADVSPGEGNTFYSRFGDWLGWVCMAGFIFFMIFQSMVEKRMKVS